LSRGRSGWRSREARAVGLLFAALSLFWLVALVTYRSQAGGTGRGLLSGVLPENLCGVAGTALADSSILLLGHVAAPALPLLALALAVRLLRPPRAGGWRPFFLIGAWALFVPALLLLAGASESFAGRVGTSTAGFLMQAVGRIGAWIIVLAVAGVGLLLLTDWRLPTSLPAALGQSGRAIARFTRGASALAIALVERVRTAIGSRASRLGGSPSDEAATREATEPKVVTAIRGVVAQKPEEAVSPEPYTDYSDAEPGIIEPEAIESAARSTRRAPVKKVRREKGYRKQPADAFELPSTDLLDEPPPKVASGSREEILDLSEVIRRTLEEFGIRGRVGEVHRGPVITRYDFEPAPGIKVNQITSREDDIALALRTDRIRILSRIPGKAAVGIEIPNREPEVIYFKEIATSKSWQETRGFLPLIFGTDTEGKPFCDRLETMPHLLIAGATNSGKSVCINTIIASLLFRHRPEDLRLIMVDPKMLELTSYNGIPHLALPVVTEARDAAKALQWLVAEMERRYRVFAARGVRNIQSYRAKSDGPVDPDEEPMEHMPYIVLVVDELADLMMTYASEIETPVARLAQMARAVGIHIILATQRPSVDVITGVIKANFPARIAFQVASKVDSRTILDQNGAETLIGRGDMLYLPAGRPAPIRLHGAFLTDEDNEKLVDYLKGFVSALDPIDIEGEEKRNGGVPSSEDPLFQEAARLVVLQGQASTSFLQRRLKVGYARAGRIVDQLEQAGIVGGFEGSKAREVLVDISYLEEHGIV